MKNLIFFTSLILFISSPAFSQNEEVIGLVKQGIEQHDNGNYKEAIRFYEEALNVDPNAPLVHYELGYSYYALEQYDKAIDYCNNILKIGKGQQKDAYLLMANSFDHQGKSKKALKTYQKAIKLFPDAYLLHYNMGLTHYKIGELKKAEAAVIEAINNNLSHGSSHNLLGQIKADQGERIPALLSTYFFLLLEQGTDRTAPAYELLIGLIRHGVTQKDESNIEISLAPNSLEGEFSSAELMLSLKEATRYGKEGTEQTEEEIFFENTETLFSILEESRESKSGIWWDLYVSFFSEIMAAGHLEAFCYYISQSEGGPVDEWIEAHPEKVEAFFNWVKEE